MSTQDPYGSSDPSREQRTGSSPVGGSGSGPSQYGSSYGQPQGQPDDAPRDGQYGQQPQQYGQQPQQYGQGYPAQGGYDGRPAPRNGLGTAALVLGILGLLLSIIPAIGVLFGVLGLVAVVLGVIGLRRVKRGQATNRGAALTGIITGVLAIVVSAVWLVLLVIGFGAASDCSSFLSSNDQAGYQQCINQQVQDLSS